MSHKNDGLARQSLLPSDGLTGAGYGRGNLGMHHRLGDASRDPCGASCRERAPRSKRRITGPDCVIFMCYRRAEKRHDAVAQNLVDGAVVAVHGTHHRLDGRIEDASCILRVGALDKLPRASK